ncbi:MAG TPA: metallophosphoesterase [Candidatus Methylacidiphilales bacterium]
MNIPGGPPFYSRRHFLQRLLGASLVAATGLDSLLAQSAASPPEAFRFAFLTDLHLLKDGDLRSAEGITACLAAVEKLDLRPDFILVGGDLVDRMRDLTVTEAERRLDFFLKIWKDNTSLPAHWTFGNHDLVGTSNPAVSPDEKYYGKALFQDRLQLAKLYYSFDHKGWHFVVLDDIAPQPDRTYIGKLFDDELGFLKADLHVHRTMPTIVCTHIPTMSAMPVSLFLAHSLNLQFQEPKSMVCTNSDQLFQDFTGHNIRAVLSGHLHHFEKIDLNGIRFINSGAVCGSYWKGPVYDSPEGFGVVDVAPDGSVAFEYRDYGWKA